MIKNNEIYIKCGPAPGVARFVIILDKTWRWLASAVTDSPGWPTSGKKSRKPFTFFDNRVKLRGF